MQTGPGAAPEFPEQAGDASPEDHASRDAPADDAPSDQHDEEGRPESPNEDNTGAHPLHVMGGFSVSLSVDSDSSDNDSSLGFSRPSSTMSATSSVYDFVEYYGRTFHKYKEGKYVMPNDEQEQSRLDLQHAIMDKVLDGNLSTAPIKSPPRVLDLGTGTGIWALEFADKNPSSSIIGTDLSPIQPEYVPPNCRFEIDDCEDEWVWGSKFDYIHGRYLVPFLGDVPKLLRNIYENLVPGGIVEFQEAALVFMSVDDTLEGKPIEEWNRKILEGMRRNGREPLIALQLRELMEAAGFVNIHERRIAIPINPWPRGEKQKLIGMMEMQNFLEVCHGISMNVLAKGMGWPTEEVELLLVQVRENFKDKSIHAYFPFVCIWGEKPA